MSKTLKCYRSSPNKGGEEVKDLNQTQKYTHSWMLFSKGLNLLMVSVFPKLIYKYNTILAEILIDDSKFLKDSQKNSGKEK